MKLFWGILTGTLTTAVIAGTAVLAFTIPFAEHPAWLTILIWGVVAGLVFTVIISIIVAVMARKTRKEKPELDPQWFALDLVEALWLVSSFLFTGGQYGPGAGEDFGLGDLGGGDFDGGGFSIDF